MAQRQLRPKSSLHSAGFKGPEDFDRVIGMLQAGWVGIRIGLAKAEKNSDPKRLRKVGICSTFSSTRRRDRTISVG
jgi:hypothetical protein